ncbi:hypothetical protein [Flavobacterium ginsenosidimutans]|uniref:hypothetical protein n=1 Tax=Flavobacterium ginsenosidimutans TaxID=687844 RepID=UPI000DACE103|nr:hypothetical protein [Flavobacterium ginsenosidimutans]KAF2328096.1 hypothetical protein DM444_20085 [Flavobacterium ginsenosidimutans]
MMLDKYFKEPLLWDYIISSVITCISVTVYIYNFIELPKIDRSLSITSDLSNVGLTSAGFILTLLTVLITFKSNVKITKENYNNDDPLFELFFASDLYLLTVKILKNCIKSLIFISVFGYCLKIGLPQTKLQLTFFFNIFGLSIIALTLWRCLLILTKILKMQE